MLGYIRSDKKKINVEEHKIYSFDVLQKTKLRILVIKNNKVLYQNNIIFNASCHGHLIVLKWFKNSGYYFKIDRWSICAASKYGHIDILEWFKKSGNKFYYDYTSMIEASRYGHIKVLEWFKKNNLKLKFHHNAITDSKTTGILKFWCENKIKNVILCKFLLILKNINKFKKTIKFKTKNNYLKGYNKN